MASELAAVESRLRAHPTVGVAPIPEVGAHLFEAGGKRLRPLLLLLAARAHDVPADRAVPLAAAAELLHTASLLHDDVVDEADRRRGRPAARHLWGNAATVLAGDYFLAQGLHTLASLGDPRPVGTLSEVVADLAEGELLQLAHRGQWVLDEPHYFAVARRKTASLITWCARVGGLLAPEADSAMGAYGAALGIAFQLRDDLLDLAGDPATTGKDIGADLREGKMTLPLLIACRRRPEIAETLQTLAACPQPAPDLARRARDAVVQSGALAETQRRARQLADRAARALTALPAGPERTALVALARSAADRPA